MRPLRAAPCSTDSQWLPTYVGFRFRLIGQKPRSPASFSVSEPLLTPATPIGGCGFWNGVMCGLSVPSIVPVLVTCQYLPL